MPTPVQTLEKSIVIIPEWVIDMLQRKKLKMASVLDYSVMHDCMSLEDCAALLRLQKAEKINLFKNAYQGFLLNAWEHSSGEEKRAVLDTAVTPMAYSEKAFEDTYERLSLDEDTPKDSECWAVVDFDRNALAVVLRPGAVEALSDTTQQLELSRAILRVFYGYKDTHEVSQTSIFGKYIELLDSQ